jgi:hypothetical protein
MKTKSTFKIIGFVLAVAIVLLGGIGITGAAAQAAIPGDALYPLKTTIESTRLMLAQNAGDRAQMNLAFAEQRLTEISNLIHEGRVREIRNAVLAFETHINAALMELETISASDPARAAAVAKEVTSALTRYAQSLSELAATAPENIKPEVVRALDTTQIATGLGQSAENENANANDNSNGNDNENGNSNANDNAGDDNGNGNGNDNGDDNSNLNANDNSNDDNSNGNGNGNGNDNDDDDNGNGNDDDDNGNDDRGGHGGDDDNDNDDRGGHGGDDDDDDDDKGGKGHGSDD